MEWLDTNNRTSPRHKGVRQWHFLDCFIFAPIPYLECPLWVGSRPYHLYFASWRDSQAGGLAFSEFSDQMLEIFRLA
jgi:hypothetical protein